MSDSGCEWLSESRSEIGNEVIRLRAELAAMTAEVQTGAKLCADLTADLDAALTQLVGTNKQAKEEAVDQAQADGEIQEIVGKYMKDITRLEAQLAEYERRLNHQTSCYSAGLQNLRGRIEDLEVQNVNLLAHAESNNELLRAATKLERAVIEALGPYALSGNIAKDVRELRAKLDAALKAPCPYEEENAALQDQLKERTENADFLRSMVGACHLMISRNDLEELQRQEWEATTLPPRLHKFVIALVAKCERLVFDHSDPANPITKCLTLLSDGYISIGKAVEWLDSYIATGIEQPIADGSGESIWDENERLKRQCERLSAPVSDEEWAVNHWVKSGGSMRGFVDTLIAARAGKVQP